MKNTTHTAKTFTLSRPAEAAAARHGFTKDDLAECFLHPKAVYPNKQRPGQWRVADRNVCLVGIFDGDTLRVLTLFPNGSEAPRKAA